MSEAVALHILALASADESRRSAARDALRAQDLAVLPDLLAAYRKAQVSEHACAEVIAGMSVAACERAIEVDAGLARQLIAALALKLPSADALMLIRKHLAGKREEHVAGACSAVRALRERAVATGEDPVSLLRPVLPNVIAVFGHPTGYVAGYAYGCIRKLDPVLELPALIATLQRLHAEGDRGISEVVGAIGAHGRDAAAAVPVLHEVLRGSSGLAECCEALVAIGANSPDSIALMEAARDRPAFTIKSQGTAYRRRVNAAIKALKATLQPAKGGAPLSESQERLLDLINRMAGAERYETTSYEEQSAARAQATELSDPALLEDVAVLMRGKLSRPQLSQAVVLLGLLTRSTGSERGKQLIREVLERPKLHDHVAQVAIYAATDAELRDVLPFMRRQLAEKHDLSALEYMQKLKLEECVDDIVAFMNVRRDHVQLGLCALIAIGSPNVLPHMLHYARREYASRKSDEWWWRTFAVGALSELGEHDAMVDELLRLLSRYADSRMAIVRALIKRNEPRACDAIVRALGDQVQAYTRSSESLGVLSFIDFNAALEWIKTLGRHREPAISALVSRLSEPELWARLPRETQAYLAAYFE